MPPTSLDIVVLNYNGWKDTIECLDSLLAGWRKGYKITVVDNCSSDDSIQRLTVWAEQRHLPARFICEDSVESPLDDRPGPRGEPEITTLRPAINGGFSAGNNIGIRYALECGAEWILLLNNDTIVPPDSLHKLQVEAEQAGAALAGPSIYLQGSPSTASYLGGKFSWWGDKHVTSPGREASALAKAKETDWITGCCLLVRADVFGKIGFLDENSFLYCEDADFCRRAAKAGFKRVVVPAAIIYHKVGATVGFESALARYHLTRSRMYFNAKHYSAAAHGAFVCAFSLSRILLTVVWLIRRRADLIRATWGGIRDGLLLTRTAHTAPQSGAVGCILARERTETGVLQPEVRVHLSGGASTALNGKEHD